VYSMYVHPTMQRTGCAQRLFVHTVNEGLRRFPHCAARLVVVTFELNTPGRRFYEKMGGTLRGVYGGYPVHGGLWNVAFYEWEDVSVWVARWEEKYGEEGQMKEKGDRKEEDGAGGELEQSK